MKFHFQGGAVEAKDGDTIAAALYRHGQRTFSRSFKYHRPRGLLCVRGKCPNCLMNVDGIPNIRTCITPVRDGMRVKAQNAFPSLETDWLSITQRLDWLMPVGWYYKTFTHRALWHAAEPIIRKVAGLGEVLTSENRSYEHSWMHCDRAVIGGGWAGIEAAQAAGARGEQVVLVDDQPALGGQSRYRKHAEKVSSDRIERLQALPNVRILLDSYCFGLYEGNLLGIVQRNPHPGAAERLVHLRAQHTTLASGTFETPLLFPNHDLPGIMLSTGVLRLVHLYGIAAGKRAVVVGARDAALEISAELREAGIEVVATVRADQITMATGSACVQGIQTEVGRFACDLVAVCGPQVPDAGLAAQAGGKLTWSAAHAAFLPTGLPAHVSLLGAAAGEGLGGIPTPVPPSKRVFVCLCSDVSSQDLCDGIAEGFDHIETLKRYTTATMGPCQGRMCQLSAIGVCARQTGRSIAETGVTTSRPPNPGVTLGALAGPSHHPIRRTPMHYAHEKLGAVWMDMSDWKRPRYYRTSSASAEKECVLAEYRAVREEVGIIDVSTLGKLVLRGADCGKLLDKVYTHRFSDLRPGRVRYALMCDEGGIILDDGTIARLSDDRYFVTTTTGNLEFVHQWLDWYLAGSGWDVHIANVTAGYGAMNIAGPRSREVLSKLTDCDLTSAAFPYMACREAEVAAIPVAMLRIGFVGETGWEIHCPAESAEALWEAVLEAGRELNIRPFGVEAQRLLRLEKRHVIVGVDTDALTNPYEADLAWAVKLEKPDFVGKAVLSRAQDLSRERLIGFVLRGPGLPEDGAAIVADGALAGRVTSTRHSPARQAAVGLGWVKVAQAKEGASVDVRVDGKLVPATITLQPFYDPEGGRLRQ
ncbi:MAG TPA: 2Fe-2S iron-sulfur cluster-binding protein [Terriglobales bacterium]|nr:2Fe-2S iron-sulfur cluster-binding protein [Terriglobales bacterium]